MHDPMTVAFTVKSPFKSRPSPMWPDGYRNDLVTIWHVDPERRGDEDSCGWSYPRLTKDQQDRLHSVAWAEAREPWFQRLRCKRVDDPLVAECLMRGAVELVVRVLGVRASYGEICRWAGRMVHNPLDNFRSSLCHLPGYHTNFERDTADHREDTAYGLFAGIAAHVLRERRPWWRHPRFHWWHWKLQIHPLQRFRRWLLTRCQHCGGPFRRGDVVIGLHWDSAPPRWFEGFRGERDVVHDRCHDAMMAPVRQEAAARN